MRDVNVGATVALGLEPGRDRERPEVHVQVFDLAGPIADETDVPSENHIRT